MPLEIIFQAFGQERLAILVPLACADRQATLLKINVLHA
jgi:hypothetical protein